MNFNSHNHATYNYNAMGQRIEKTVNGVTENFLFDGATIIGVWDANNNPTASYLTPFSGENLNMVIGGNAFYFTQDGFGSVREVVNSSTQQPVNTCDYTAFGVALNWTGPVDNNRFTFLGLLQDNESGTNFNGASSYTPSTGLFNQGHMNDSGYLTYNGLTISTHPTDYTIPVKRRVPQPTPLLTPIPNPVPPHPQLWDWLLGKKYTKCSEEKREIGEWNLFEIGGPVKIVEEGDEYVWGSIECKWKADINLTCKCTKDDKNWVVKPIKTVIKSIQVSNGVGSGLFRFRKAFSLFADRFTVYYLEPDDLKLAGWECKNHVKPTEEGAKLDKCCDDLIGTR
jgi:hypothetical protein